MYLSIFNLHPYSDIVMANYFIGDKDDWITPYWYIASCMGIYIL